MASTAVRVGDHENTELRAEEIPTLPVSEYRDCRRILYDDLTIGQKAIGHMHSWALKDEPKVDTIGWVSIQH
jgi:hypothetical protein